MNHTDPAASFHTCAESGRFVQSAIWADQAARLMLSQACSIVVINLPRWGNAKQKRIVRIRLMIRRDSCRVILRALSVTFGFDVA